MKTTKQIISIILLLTLLAGMVPTTVQAEGMQTTVENSGTTIEGTNSFGTLLSEDIQEQQAAEEENYSGGYNVIGLTIENGVATVQYDTLEEAILVVSLYTEDGLQLLVSGKAVVQPEETVAVITLEGEIPEYFMASAYLLDTYDYSPLCASYDTPMYTKEMQELLASTTDDYDADKVLNLDDDKTTNFAVYADTTKVLEYAEGVNTVVSADDETSTYVIENADENITGLKAGDVLAYAYGENQILIVKVASIALDGTTATITGDDLEMEEVFTHVKMETTGDASDITVDESTAEEGVVYDGLSSEGVQTYSLRAIEGESGWKHYLNFKLVDKKIKEETDNADVSISLSGSLGISLDVKFTYYVATDRQFIEFKTDAGIKASISIGGKIKGKLPLPEFKLTAYGISIGFEPKIQLEFSGKVEYSFFAGFTIGISYENGKGIHDLSTAPKVESEFKLEGSIFFGIDLTPTIEVLKGAIAEAKLEAPIGFELKASLKGTLIEGSDPDSIHTCEKCVEMELNFKAEFSAKLKFLKCKWLSLETKAKAVEIKIGDMYWSIDREEFAWGKCPHISYRVTVYVQDFNSAAVADTDVVAGWEEQMTEIPMGTTNGNGVVVDYLKAGTYTFMATVDGENLRKTVTVEESCKVVLGKNTTGNNPEFVFGSVNPEDITDYGVVVASGECGAEGDNVIWTQYENGILVIDGTGEMKNFSYYWNGNNIPWGESIQYVIINDGVTSIGNNAFRSMEYLESIAIPPSIRSIREDAFYYCQKLSRVYITDLIAWCDIEFESFGTPGGDLYINGTSAEKLVIPDSVTRINPYAFAGCGNIVCVEIPNSVTQIGESAFSGCSSLALINIPSGVTCIEDYVFSGCDSLVNLEIPNNITTIGCRAFFDCNGLEDITLPDSVTYIGQGAFEYCDKLERIFLPNSLEGIGAAAFSGCPKLASVIIPNRVTTIEAYTFQDCKSLTDITIPNSVTNICSHAFDNCVSLKAVYIDDMVHWCNILFDDITANPLWYANNLYEDDELICDLVIPNGLTRINDSTFANCTSLTSVVLPDSLTFVGNSVFSGCSELEQVFLPDSVTSIGENAFMGCESLISIEIPNSVTSIGGGVFSECKSLKSVVIPNGVTTIKNYTFNRCSNLESISIPNSVTTIGSYAFYRCLSLSNIIIPSGITDIGYVAFGSCGALKTMTFEGNKPNFYSSGVFSSVTTVTAYYPSSNETWTADGLQNYGGTITWIPYTLDANGEMIVDTAGAMIAVEFDEVQDDPETEADDANYGISTLSIWGGEYETEVTDTYTLKRAFFTGLVPGEEYVLLALVNIGVEEILAPDNLLYIDQEVATEDGTLVFTYAQRETTDISYVMACGASHNDIKDAVITFPEMAAGTETQTVDPTVVHNGKTLVEGVDYVIVGTVDYTEAGVYTCYIRGIYNYTGLVECQYTVDEKINLGDFTADGYITNEDVVCLLWNVLFPEEYPLSASGDLTGDGVTDNSDVVLLLWHVLFPEENPI